MKELKAIGACEEEIQEVVRTNPGIQSVSAAVENLMLAAADMGYGTCWMTSGNYAAREKILLDILRGKIRGEEIEHALNRYNINLNELAIICIENDYYEKALENNDYDMLYSQNEYIKVLTNKIFHEYTQYFIECHENIFAFKCVTFCSYRKKSRKFHEER